MSVAPLGSEWGLQMALMLWDERMAAKRVAMRVRWKVLQRVEMWGWTSVGLLVFCLALN
jgi:hypothetical protein